MEDAQEARSLLAQQKYDEAGRLLDRLILSSRENDELWYLRGMICLKMKNYDAALECFERALVIGRKSRYFQMKGMALFEIFDMEEAARSFEESLAVEPDNAVSHFFLALCLMFLHDPRSGEHMREAYRIDQKKTKQLLLNFYSLFLQNDPRLSAAQKERLEQRMKDIRG